jgi:hypothetical protein
MQSGGREEGREGGREGEVSEEGWWARWSVFR